MKIVRYLFEGRVSFGIIEDERLYPCGHPFINPAKQTGAIDLFSVKLLAPVSPPNIICIGLDSRNMQMKPECPILPSLWFS